MFTVRFGHGVCLGYRNATAQAPTERQALDFIEAFAPGRCGIIVSNWFAEAGRFTMIVWDWCDCCTDRAPVLAEVIAPPGFRPDAARQL